jgi:ABC-type polysaccharide/polyol phosphate transport system ATPase subunit
MATVDDKKIIFSMVGLSKTIRQTNKQVLKNIYLSFFYGAKIGIIGLNGSGKSTLMKSLPDWTISTKGKWCFPLAILWAICHRIPTLIRRKP